jgi:hypothetical protein
LTVTGHDRRRAAVFVYNLTPLIRGDGLGSFRFLSVDAPVQEAPAFLKAAPIVAPIGIAAAALMLPISIPLGSRRRPRPGGSAAVPARLSKAGV